MHAFYSRFHNFGFICLFSVAHGACVHAAVLTHNNDIPLTIGVIGRNRSCIPLIRRNTPIPIEKVVHGSTSKDDQSKAKITFVEGEQPNMTVNGGNMVLGMMVVDNLTLSPKGHELVDIHIQIDEKGIISAKATDQRTKNQADIKIKRPEHFSHLQLIEMSECISSLKKGLEIENLPNVSLQLPHFYSSYKRQKYDDSEKIQLQITNEICPIYGSRGSEEVAFEFELEDSC